MTPPASPPVPEDPLVISYLFLRKMIGGLGIGLPFALLIGSLVRHFAIQDSMSAYYHTDMRNIFVGTLCAIGVFFWSYRGYERKDAIAGDLACAFAVGVALFPVNPPGGDSPIGYFHYVFATSLFLTLSYFSLCLFTKTNPAAAPTPKKLQRNIVYRVCGYTMLAAIAAIAVIKLLHLDESLNPVFGLEATTVVAFGVSWLTKGEAILKDEA
jgi:hypothetical protein